MEISSFDQPRPCQQLRGDTSSKHGSSFEILYLNEGGVSVEGLASIVLEPNFLLLDDSPGQILTTEITDLVDGMILGDGDSQL
jgi:hypothetical protein